MSQTFRRKQVQQTNPGLDLPELLALLLGMAVALLCALPALVIGLVAERLLRKRPWSTLLWFTLAILGLGFTVLLALHGLGQLVFAQLHMLVHEARVHQAHLFQWNNALLWATTWPVWLETLGLAPVVAAVRTLASQIHRDGATSLLGQERLRQQAVKRAQRRAARRLRHLHRLPDAIRGHMLIGIPIDDESNR